MKNWKKILPDSWKYKSVQKRLADIVTRQSTTVDIEKGGEAFGDTPIATYKKGSIDINMNKLAQQANLSGEDFNGIDRVVTGTTSTQALHGRYTDYHQHQEINPNSAGLLSEMEQNFVERLGSLEFPGLKDNIDFTRRKLNPQDKPARVKNVRSLNDAISRNLQTGERPKFDKLTPTGNKANKHWNEIEKLLDKTFSTKNTGERRALAEQLTKYIQENVNSAYNSHPGSSKPSESMKQKHEQLKQSSAGSEQNSDIRNDNFTDNQDIKDQMQQGREGEKGQEGQGEGEGKGEGQGQGEGSGESESSYENGDGKPGDTPGGNGLQGYQDYGEDFLDKVMKESERSEKIRKDLLKHDNNPYVAKNGWQRNEVRQGRKNLKRYNMAKNKVAGIARKLRKRIDEMRLYNQTRRETGLKAGKITMSQMSRKDQLIFHRKDEKNQEADLAVLLLVDESGSMSGDNIRGAREAAVLMAEAFQKTKIPFSVFGHTSRGNDYNLNLIEYLKFEDDIRTVKYKIGDMQARAGNNDAGAVMACWNYLNSRPEKDKVLIVFSDGQPTECSTYDLKNAVKRVTKEGGHCIGIGLAGYNAIENYYPDNIVINDSADLVKAMPDLIEKLIFK